MKAERWKATRVAAHDEVSGSFEGGEAVDLRDQVDGFNVGEMSEIFESLVPIVFSRESKAWNG